MKTQINQKNIIFGKKLKVKFFLLAFAIFIILFSTVFVFADPAGWGIDTRVSFASPDSVEPSLAIDGGGNVHIAWEDERDGNTEIYYKKLDNSGNSLTGEIRLTTNFYESKIPSLAIDGNGNVHVVWMDDRGGSPPGFIWDIYYTKLDNSGTTLVDDTAITNTADYYNGISPALFVDGSNNLHLAWADDRDAPLSSTEIYYKKLNNNGFPLTFDILVSSDLTSLSEEPSLAVDGSGDVHIAWGEQLDLSNQEIYYKKLSSTGANLTSDIRLTTAAEPSVTPSLGLDSQGNVHIAWEDWRDGNNGEIYYTKLDNGGSTVVDDTRLTANPALSISLSLSINSNNEVSILWADGRDGNMEIYHTKLGINGNTIVDDTRLTYNPASSGLPSGDIDSQNNIHLAWTDGRHGWPNSEIYYKRSVINLPPTLAPIGNQQVNEGQQLTIQLIGSDPYNDPLLYGTNAGSVLPSPFSFNATSGLFQWTPTYNDAGQYAVTFNVTDGELSDSEAIMITVIDVPPSGVSCGDTINAPGSYSLTDNISTTSGVCITISANNVVLDCNNYWITGTGGGDHGIYMEGTGNTIKNCNIKDFRGGCCSTGIGVASGGSHVIENNNLLNNVAGLKLFPLSGSNNNKIMNNYAFGNTAAGFLLQTGYNNFTNNTAYSNIGSGFTYQGPDANYNIFSENIAINNSGGGFNLQPGPSPTGAKLNVFEKNIIQNNPIGIFIGFGNYDNTFRSNIIAGNGKGVSALSTEARNHLFYNNYFSNPLNAEATGSNHWNITKTPGTNIIGGPFLGGNFWSDYAGQDVNGDGIGDTNIPYNAGGNIVIGGDFLPLTREEFRTASSAGCVTPPSGLIGWWPGDGNGNDIIAGNNVNLLNGAGFGLGKVKLAFRFDGVDDFATTSTNVVITNSKMTIDAWAFPNNVQGTFQKIFKVHTAPYRDTWLGITNTGELDFYIYDANGVPHGITYPISANRWHHVAGTYDGSVQNLYIDGVLVGSTPWSGSFLFNDILYMGRDNFPGHPYSGKIDEADIFNRALSQAEIQAIFNAGSAGKCKP